MSTFDILCYLFLAGATVFVILGMTAAILDQRKFYRGCLWRKRKRKR